MIAGGDSRIARAKILHRVVCEKIADGIGRVVGYKNCTATLKTTAGTLPWSHFSSRNGVSYELKTNPAIVQALKRGKFEKEMVEDSDSFSYLSILAVPTVLTLLPIALFQDASMFATVLYAMATDIASAIPIVIKGIELVLYGSRRHYAFSSDMYGMNNGTGFAAAETWAAECGMKPFVLYRGMVLITLGVSVMVFGILLETIASTRTSKRKSRKESPDADILEREAFLRRSSIDTDFARKS